MACCAVAAFIVCTVLMLFGRLRQRLFGRAEALPVRNAAVAWTLAAAIGAPTETRTVVPRRSASRWVVAVAFGLGFAGTAIAGRFVEPDAPRPVQAAIGRFVERSQASICRGVDRATARFEPTTGTSPGPAS